MPGESCTPTTLQAARAQVLAAARALGIALGLTSIALLWVVGPAINPSHYAVYHWSRPASALFLPIVLDFCLVWLAVAIALRTAETRPRARLALWLIILLFLPSIALKSWSLYMGTIPSHGLSRSLAAGALASYVFLLGFWRSTWYTAFNRVVGFGYTVLLFAAVSGLALLTETLWSAEAARGLNDPPAHPLTELVSYRSRPHRVIWIVLDELAYRQVYEHRYPGLKLPAFDALAQESTVFTDVLPVGNLTENVMPALMTGHPVDRIESSPAGWPSMHDPNTGAWSAFNQHDTVFQDALNAGANTGVAGWHNPYCRLLRNVLDRCAWSNDLQLSNGMFSDASVLANMLAPLELFATKGVPLHLLQTVVPVEAANVRSADVHAREFQRISVAADGLLRDRNAGFVLLHLPIPHPPGIYNRRTGEMTDEGATYIDNLALADEYMAHVRELLSRTGQWDSSTLVVMGDHGWRAHRWRTDLGWTAEEEAASDGGTFDTRPAYLVKLPGERRGGRISAAFPALRTRALLDALLHRQLRSPEDLARWVGEGR